MGTVTNIDPLVHSGCWDDQSPASAVIMGAVAAVHAAAAGTLGNGGNPLVASKIAAVLTGYGCTGEDALNLLSDPESRATVEHTALGPGSGQSRFERGKWRTADEATWKMAAAMCDEAV